MGAGEGMLKDAAVGLRDAATEVVGDLDSAMAGRLPGLEL